MTDTIPQTSTAKDSRTALLLKLATAFVVPLFFVIAFPLLFVGAIHNPTPNNLSLLVVGPDEVVSGITDGLDTSDEFAATHTDVEGEAKSSVEQRSVMGAIEIAPTATETESVDAPAFTVTTFVASAEGASVAAAVRAVGADVADELGVSSTEIDVAPLDSQDPLGSNLFSLLTYTSLSAYLVIIVLMQVLPGAKLRIRYAAVGVAAIVAPLMVFGLSSIFVGDYGASFGTIVALLGVNTLYVFTVGAAAVLIEQFLGKMATIGIMGFIVLLNFPSSGGPTPAALLPSFWQSIHNFYFGAGAYESFRSIIYFDGSGAQRWILQLAGWTVGLVMVTVIVHLSRKVFALRTQVTDLTSLATAALPSTVIPTPATPATAASAEHTANEKKHVKHVKHEIYEVAVHPDRHEPIPPRALTSGEGVTR